jgi:hypothetical protein
VSFGLEARFQCGKAKPIAFELVERTEGQLEIPPGCPHAGEKLSLEVNCSRGVCEGLVRRGHLVLGTLVEANGALQLSTSELHAKGPAGQLALAVVSRKVLTMSGPGPERALRITAETEGGSQAMVLGLPGQRTTLTLDGAAYEVSVVRARGARVTLEVSADGNSRLRRELAIGEPVTLDCRAKKLACDGKVRFAVREQQ